MENKVASNKKKTILIVGIVLLGLLLIVSTYALLRLAINVTNGIYNVTSVCFDINYDSGEDITGTLFPSASPQGGLTGSVSIGIDEDCNVNALGNLYLNVNNNSSSILTQVVEPHCENSTTLETLTSYTTPDTCAAQTDAVWVTDGTALKYAVYVSDVTEPVSVGYIDTLGDAINIYEEFRLSNTLTQYDIYVWLDGHVSDDTYQNLSFGGSVSAEVMQTEGAVVNKPVLDDGMIPVTISADGVVTTVAEDDSSWYNYDNKEWANVVLVKEEGAQTRDYYKNNVGKTVSEDDILAYYVWIPRYKYAFPKADGNPESISIVFESASAAKSTGTATGTSYYTHPAFIWDGETVAGIWVGKFETGHSSLSSSTTSNNLGCTDTNCANADGLIIKPNVQSLRYNNVSNFFYASRAMTRGTNPFGLNASTTDTHMMKNSEWGAVAYLSHSKYGINQEIYINNSSNYYTGRSGGNVAGSVDTRAEHYDGQTSTNKYIFQGYYTWTGQEIDVSGIIGSYASDRTLGTNASTTGNVTGVYDMSGGTYEYVMGNYGNTAGSSGFTTLPNSKYYDLYSSTQFTGDNSTNVGLCTLETCGGHALSETANWYGDNANFVNSDYPWFKRGGNYISGPHAGAFNSINFNGGVLSTDGFRFSAIVKGA